MRKNPRIRKIESQNLTLSRSRTRKEFRRSEHIPDLGALVQTASGSLIRFGGDISTYQSQSGRVISVIGRRVTIYDAEKERQVDYTAERAREDGRTVVVLPDRFMGFRVNAMTLEQYRGNRSVDEERKVDDYAYDYMSSWKHQPRHDAVEII